MSQYQQKVIAYLIEENRVLVFDGTIHSPTGTANTTWQKVSHGFRLGGMVQYYSALPFNVTAGTNTLQGPAARPTVSGTFISRNVGNGFDFFNVNARLSRTFQATEDMRLEGTFEAFNIINVAWP